MDWKVLLLTSHGFTAEISDNDSDYYTRPYDILIDGKKILSSDHSICSVGGLKPDTEYEVTMRREEKSSNSQMIHTKPEKAFLDVRKFGAAGDGKKDDTAALQAAVLSCPDGGCVYVPEGTYRFTHLFLRSNFTFEIGENALLLGIPDPDLFPVLPGAPDSEEAENEFRPGVWEGDCSDSYVSLITGMFAENVVICGHGTIDGNAGFDNWWNLENRTAPVARPRMLYLYHCKNITMDGITIRNSPAWNLHPFCSEKLRFLNLKIESPDNSPNTDGIDPDSCVNVEIAGIYFSVGDDCIAIKSGVHVRPGQDLIPSKDIWIHHCLMQRGHGAVSIGSESANGVKNICVQNCLFRDTDRGLRIKTRRGRGQSSYTTGIEFENVKMDGVKTPFVINCFYFCGPGGKTDYVRSKETLPADERTPRIGSISISHVECLNCQVAGVYFYGLPESRIESVKMNDVHIKFAKDPQPGIPAMMDGCEECVKKGIFLRNVAGLYMKDVIVEGNEGETIDSCETNIIM